jgi:predicted Ser/Thr protein kinase
MIGSTIRQYKIVEKLGEGGMGEVYLAEDAELKRKVALKFLPEQYASDPEALARFKREAQTAAGLHHPNIVTVYEVGQHQGRPYIAMAYVEGEPLTDIITRKEFTVDRAIDIASQICDGLNNAHGAGIVHRDIKPDNILVDKDGRVKILDFGLAKLGGVSRITGELSTMGTIFYMSPEQTQGSELDNRSDLFSLGAVLYEMLAGRPPFAGEHTAAVIYSITNEEPRPLSQFYQRVPRAMEHVVSKALEKKPADRYQSAAEFAEDLERVKAGMAPVAAGSRLKALKLILPTSVVFLAVVLFVVFKPFSFQISGNDPAVAAEHSLAIMYFENYVDRSDPKRLGEIVSIEPTALRHPQAAGPRGREGRGQGHGDGSGKTCRRQMDASWEHSSGGTHVDLDVEARGRRGRKSPCLAADHWRARRTNLRTGRPAHRGDQG